MPIAKVPGAGGAGIRYDPADSFSKSVLCGGKNCAIFVSARGPLPADAAPSNTGNTTETSPARLGR